MWESILNVLRKFFGGLSTPGEARADFTAASERMEKIADMLQKEQERLLKRIHAAEKNLDLSIAHQRKCEEELHQCKMDLTKQAARVDNLSDQVEALRMQLGGST